MAPAPIPPDSSTPNLATNPRIVDELATALRAAGLVGDERAAQLIYLAITSRLLKRPVSLIVKGTSSSGKNFTVGSVVKFFPATAVIELTSASEKALVYTKEVFRHRTIVLYEAPGLAGGFMAYVVRSLQSEGRIRYETTVRNEKTGRFETQPIEKEGPTGLIVTTTAEQLHEENETRTLSIRTDESKTQTERILMAQAEAAAGIRLNVEPDVREWHALQVWLAANVPQIVVPWAPSLAEMVPTDAVRARRDLPTLLSLIRSHALLHQATRERDEAGNVVATIAEDYRAVYTLTHELFAEAAEVTVSPAIRDTVEAVKRGAATLPDIMKQLGIARQTASWRVKKAIELGYIENAEQRRGHPADLQYCKDVPDEADGTGLPDPEDLLANS